MHPMDTTARPPSDFGWSIIRCAVQGRGHAADGTPCQDKLHSCTRGDFHAIALADGAGSAAMAHEGAQLAAEYACRTLARLMDSTGGEGSPPAAAAAEEEIVSGLRQELQGLAGELGCGLADLASTLLAVAVKEGRYTALHLGDGVIGCLRGDEAGVLSEPENGEYANTTFFTTSASAAGHLRIMQGSLDGLRGFLLISDGAAASLYRKADKTLAPAAGAIMQQNLHRPTAFVQQQLSQLFESRVRERTMDDCSIIAMTRATPLKAWADARDRQLQSHLLGYKRRVASRILEKYGLILELAGNGAGIQEIAAAARIPAKRLFRLVSRLRDRRLLQQAEPEEAPHPPQAS